MIKVYRWDKAQKRGEWLPAEVLRDQPERLRNGQDVIWVDMENPDEAEEELVFKNFFLVHPLTLEDITKPRWDQCHHLPKVEEFSDHLFVIVNPLPLNFRNRVKEGESPWLENDALQITQLSAVLTQDVLITVQYEPLFSIQEVRTYLQRDEAKAERGPDYLFHLILDIMFDQFLVVLERFNENLEEMEDDILCLRGKHKMGKILRLKRQIISLRKTLVHAREIIARMSRGEFKLIEEQEIHYYRNVYDHLIRFIESIDNSREMVNDLTQSQLTMVSNNLNNIMKVLAMISTIVLPMSLVAGIYGMNFEFPEKAWGVRGYWYSLGLMALIGIGTFAYFRWKKWI